MTGGLGFVKDGMNAQKRNRRMVDQLGENHFKSQRPKSDFARTYTESKVANKETIEAITVQLKNDSRRNILKSIILLTIAVIIVFILYFLPIILKFAYKFKSL